ncbi:MAG: sigma-54 dependent transcriptional regulator [Pyrinomonadaceae bacterium]|nr:sigma-54 dependent transcriptional regulator [Pyrinomonadaceae bacterium]
MEFVKQSLQALVIDDEKQVRGFIAEILRGDGWIVTEVGSADQAFDLINENWLLVICDVMLGEEDGYSVLHKFAEIQPEARFVLMTGFGSAAGALDATAIGAYDYLVKPVGIDNILHISKTVREQFQNRSNQKIETEMNPLGYVSDVKLIGKSQTFVECLKLVGRVAGTNLPVLITGESGTGKEVVAQAIHRRSNRAKKEFVAVNCSAIPTELIESELFGHSKGSFTGADRERIGLWEEANGGTIFLDEITETSLHFQVKLLRVLQQGEIRRVGSNRTIKVDVRVIAATNRDIEEEVKQGRFREDLMYRLNSVTIKLPPLRERIEDIPLLASYFVKTARPDSSMSFTSKAMDLLKNYYWKGNIRELENAVLHAVSMTDDLIYPEHLPAQINKIEISDNQNLVGASIKSVNWLTLAEQESKYVEEVLEYTGGNKQAASRILNIDRKTLNRIIQRTQNDSKS